MYFIFIFLILCKLNSFQQITIFFFLNKGNFCQVGNIYYPIMTCVICMTDSETNTLPTLNYTPTSSMHLTHTCHYLPVPFITILIVSLIYKKDQLIIAPGNSLCPCFAVNHFGYYGELYAPPTSLVQSELVSSHSFFFFSFSLPFEVSLSLTQLSYFT